MSNGKIAEIGKGKAGPGRPKGSVNRITGLLKDAILEAASRAGEGEGLVGYLQKQAIENPTAFLSLLGRVLPHTLTGDPAAPIRVTEIRRVIVASRWSDGSPCSK